MNPENVGYTIAYMRQKDLLVSVEKFEQYNHLSAQEQAFSDKSDQKLLENPMALAMMFCLFCCDFNTKLDLTIKEKSGTKVFAVPNAEQRGEIFRQYMLIAQNPVGNQMMCALIAKYGTHAEEKNMPGQIIFYNLPP